MVLQTSSQASMSTSQERKLAELMVTALKNAEVPRSQAAVNKKRRKYTKKEDAFLKKNAKIHIISSVSSSSIYDPSKNGYGGAEWLQCKHCKHRTKWKSALKRHLQTKHNIAPPPTVRDPNATYFSCQYCSHSTKWLSALRRHCLTKHGIIQEKQCKNPDADYFKCNFCDHSTQWPSALARHIKTKHPGKSTIGYKKMRKQKRRTKLYSTKLQKKKRKKRNTNSPLPPPTFTIGEPQRKVIMPPPRPLYSIVYTNPPPQFDNDDGWI